MIPKKEIKRGGGSFASVSSILYKVISPILKKNGIYESKLFENWDTIIGKKLSDKVIPIKIINTRENGQDCKSLHLLVLDSASALMLDYQKDTILDNISIFFGKRFIHKVKITQNPTIIQNTHKDIPYVRDGKPIAFKIDDIEDDTLKQKLEELAKQIRA